MNGNKCKLIMTIVNRGFSEDVMDAARQKGAKGGTIFFGRGTGRSDKTFFGFAIEPEKEVIMIIATVDTVAPIMTAIYEQCGLATPGQGICFALPVEDLVGITL